MRGRWRLPLLLLLTSLAFFEFARAEAEPQAKAEAEAEAEAHPERGDRQLSVGLNDGRIVIDLPGSENARNEVVRSCTTPGGKDGYCKSLSECAVPFFSNFTLLGMSICFKSLFEPGVCCPVDSLEPNDTPRFTTTTTSRPRPITLPPPTRPPVVQPAPGEARCGVPLVPTFRIVGGEEARRGQWPWMAAVFLHGPKKTEFWCGASLVSKQHILTAAHCTKDSRGKTFNPQQFTVRLGDHSLFTNEDDVITNPRTYRVREIRPHPDFKAHGFYNDVAIIKLDKPVDFTEYILPVCLPSDSMARQSLNALVGETPTVIGWGSTFYKGQESNGLREAQLPIWRNDDCNDAYFQPITEIFLCAGYPEGGTDACQGDSGGPLVLFHNGHWIQIGIVSFGNRCAEPGYPGVYTRITQFLPWIHQNMR